MACFVSLKWKGKIVFESFSYDIILHLSPWDLIGMLTQHKVLCTVRLLPPCFTVIKFVFLALFDNDWSPDLCCCLSAELSWAHFCSDSGTNLRLRLWGRECVFTALIAGLCLSSGVSYPFQTKVCLPAVKPLTQYLASLQRPLLALPFPLLTWHFSFSPPPPHS